MSDDVCSKFRHPRKYAVGSNGESAVVRAFTSYQCGAGSNRGVDSIFGLSLVLAFSFAPRGFSPGTPVFASPYKQTFPNSNSTRNQVDEEPLLKWMCYVSIVIYLIILFQASQREVDRDFQSVYSRLVLCKTFR